MNRFFALLVALCLLVGPPRAPSFFRAGDACPTEEKEDAKEDAKETGKEAECSLGADFALARRPWKHPELRATGSLPGDWPASRSLVSSDTDAPHLRPPLSRLPRRQI